MSTDRVSLEAWSSLWEHLGARSDPRPIHQEIRRAYGLVSEIVADAQRTGDFRDDVDPNFAAMVFYGAIEQLLTGWIFDLIPATDDDYEQAKQLVIETICGGLEPRPVDAVAR